MVSSRESDHSELVRVGYMLRMYPRFTQTFVVNEILELEQQDVDVSILSLKKPTDGRFHESISRVRAKAEYAPEYLVESPGKTLRHHLSTFRRAPGAYAGAFARTFRSAGTDMTDFMQAAGVLRWVKKRRLKHVHIHFGTHEASVAYLASLMGGLSYSLTLHAFDIFRDNVDRRLLARKINASRFTVTVSEYNRRFMVENLPGVDGDKIRVNYNGIDLERFRCNGAERKPYSIVGVGRLIEKKGFIDLVRAVGRLRDRGMEIDCSIVGDGPLKDELKREIKSLNLKRSVKLVGPLSQADVRDLMARSMCMALPCIHAEDGNVDALPTVLLEAMASGCPCVSTRVSGVPEIIEDGRTGFLVPPLDDAALADAIARLLEPGVLHGEFADSGRARAEEVFDVRRNVGRMKAWFGEVTGSGASGVRSATDAASGVEGSRLSAMTETVR